MPAKGGKGRKKGEILESTQEEKGTECAKLLDKIASGEDIDPTFAFRNIFELLIDIKQMQAQMQMSFDMQTERFTEIEGKIDDLTSRVESSDKFAENLGDSLDDVKHDVKVNEIQLNENKVICKKIKLHSGAKDFHETREQTRMVLSKLLENVDMADWSVKECFRIYPNAKEPGITDDMKNHPLLIVQFHGSFQLSKFMGKLSTLKKIKGYENLVVDPWVPLCMKDEHSKAAKKAFEIRKKGKKTMIIISKKAEVVLLARENKKDSKFKKTEF